MVKGKLEDCYWLIPCLTASVARSGECEVSLPPFADKGDGYIIEIGCESTLAIATSTPFSITAPIGFDVGTCCSQIGVWCKCGATKRLLTRKYLGQWIVCSICNSYHHADCYNRKMIYRNNFICAFCTEWLDNSPKQKSLALQMITMINQTTNYRRKKDLVNVELTTPIRLAKFIALIVADYAKRSCSHMLGPILKPSMLVADLGAGAGSVTEHLTKAGCNVSAFEKSRERTNRGIERVEGARWKQVDYLSSKFVSACCSGDELDKYDCIFSNPDFSIGLQTLFVAGLMLKKNSNARLVFLLPSDYFVGSPARTRVYSLLPFTIEKVFELGYNGYYAKNPQQDRKSTDALFVIKISREEKFEWNVVSARLANLF